MKRMLDIRVPEDWAQTHLAPNVGAPMPEPSGLPLPAMLRQVLVEATDPIVQVVKAAVLKECKARRGWFYYLVMLSHRYEPEELRLAEVFRVLIDKFLIQTWGLACGTEYDVSRACPKCGSGRVQFSPLKLDIASIPKRADIAITIARDEWVISERLADLIRSHSIRGCDLKPVIDTRSGASTPAWHHLVVIACAGDAIAPTRYGLDYFRDDEKGEYTCTEHRWRGLSLLSEVYVRRGAMGDADISVTTDRTGRYVEHFQPTPSLLISRRFAELLSTERIKGYSLEVAHLV